MEYANSAELDTSNITTLVWDGDNTLWNWVDYAAVAYPQMCASIARITGIEEDKVASAMKSIYTQAGTMEHENLVHDLRESKHLEDFPHDKDPELTTAIQAEFSATRKRIFGVYKGIQKAVKLAHQKNIRNVILTDAPESQASRRLKTSHLAPYVSHLYCLKSQKLKNPPPQIAERLKKSTSGIAETTIVESEKPYTELESILGITRQEIAKTVAIIGDNPNKDMVLAKIYECLGLHAVYGTPNQADLEKLARFAPQKVLDKNSASEHGVVLSPKEKKRKSKIVRVESPYEIIKILNLAA